MELGLLKILRCPSTGSELELKDVRDVDGELESGLLVYRDGTALESSRFTGHNIMDYFLAPPAVESGKTLPRTRVMNILQKVLPVHLREILLKCYSLLVLAR